jgi:hypothetical protein
MESFEMGRIRSLHPGQWTDEDFVECSPWARLLSLGLRNEADDNGVFEWKPVRLKMRLFPADTLDIEKLLSELCEANQIMQFSLDGRTFGAIRNFRIWQSPKSPTSQYPITTEVRVYVGLGENEDAPPRRGPGRPRKSESEDIQPVSENDFSSNSEINSGEQKSFPQKKENNSLMERRGEDIYNSHHSTTDSAREDLKEDQSDEPPRPPPGPDPNSHPTLTAVMDAAGMTRVPSDWKAVLNRWKDMGADLDEHILPAIRDGTRAIAESTGKAPFTLKVFESRVIERLDAWNRKIEAWRAIPARQKAIEDNSKAEAIAEAEQDVAWANSWEAVDAETPGHPGRERVAFVKQDALGKLARLRPGLAVAA